MDGTDGQIPVIKVLFTLHAGMDTLDFVGPLEVLSDAKHNINDPNSKAFDIAYASAEENITTAQGCTFKGMLSFKEATSRLAEFDIMIVPGGNSAAVLKAKSEPLHIIKAFSDLQKKHPDRERTLMSICTGSLFLAQQGILEGLCATTHPDYYIQLENICQEISRVNMLQRTDVKEERYVVNNLRFDIEAPENEGYIRKKSDARRPSNARKGSMSWKQSNTRRESNARRASLRLGGLRVITSGGVSAGIDAALYLVSAMVSEESANEVARILQHTWNKGVVVDGIDV